MITTIAICICTVIGTVITVAGAIGRPLMDNTRSMTMLTEAVKNLSNELAKHETNNTAAHKRIHERIDRDERDLSDHEKRIGILESMRE